MEPRTPRRRLLILLAVVALGAAMLLPVAAIGADGPFDDVPADHTFATEVEWLADLGITKGCNPADGNTKFCPDNAVKRGQMAAFMYRLNDYLNASFLPIDGKAATAGHADTAGDSDLLDGMDSSDFLGVGDKAADADLLDGKNGAAYVSGVEWVQEAYTFNNWAAGTERTKTVDCPGMDYPIAGGGQESGSGTVIADSFPYFSTLTNRGWAVSWENTTGGTLQGQSGNAWVLCSDFELIIIPLSTADMFEDPNAFDG